MIHPHTELRFVSKEIGYGVFATQAIAKGSIVYIKDALEIEISPQKYLQFDQHHQDIVEKYSYIDELGNRIVSWDHAKYINHNCDCNVMSTGYGFEIAIRDIAANEEITDEYGLFNIPFPIDIDCGCFQCRKTLMVDDIDNYYASWDQKVVPALQRILDVEQPLWHLMDMDTRTALMEYISGQGEYRSVYALKFNRHEVELTA